MHGFFFSKDKKYIAFFAFKKMLDKANRLANKIWIDIGSTVTQARSEIFAT